jgi:riboflavin kinase/FMN adenylyltransferase
MRVFRDLEHLSPALFRAPAVTIGVFDGVHRGHRAIIDALRDAAREAQGDAVVVTFDRHPRLVLTGEAPPAITSLEHRLVLFERAGVDAAVVLHFDAALAKKSAEDFLAEILLGRIGARTLVLGADSHFGRGREGTIAFLEARRERLGFALKAVPLVPADAAGAGPVSSTAIRRAIAEGRLADAAAMLGRPLSLLGRVERGDERGRTLGFPTANLALHHEVCPPRGVYAARVEVDGVRYRTLVNIGTRPTFGGSPSLHVEAHLLAFEGDLYGRVLEVEFLARLRDERRFESVEALVTQIRADRDAALALEDA